MDTSVYLKTDISDNILRITLNRPEKLNCFGIPELQAIQNILEENETNPSVKAVKFSGAGKRSFSTGANLKQFKNLDRQGIAEWIKKGNDVFNYIEYYPKPTVAVIEGYALGGGLELALSCDLRIASDNSIFGNPELSHGWLPGWGGIRRLKKIVGQSRTKELIFLSKQISAEEALRIGLINQLSDSAELPAKANQLFENLIKVEPEIFAMAKAAISDPEYANSSTSSGTWFDVLSTQYSKKLL